MVRKKAKKTTSKTKKPAANASAKQVALVKKHIKAFEKTAVSAIKKYPARAALISAVIVAAIAGGIAAAKKLRD